jgi:tetratricopeptide (TPR) repeat protein
MFATSYSFLPKALQRWALRRLIEWTWLVAMVFTLGTTGVRADTNHLAGPAEFAAYARQAFDAARQRLAQDPTNSALLEIYASAGFDRGEFATNDDERAALAQECIAVCRQWVVRQPDSAAAHYYLAMNLGQLARTETVGALTLVDEMETEFKAAAKLDEHLDRGGPDRNLGLLYLEAPTFFSIGNKSKARHHLLHAIELAPDFPENRLNYIEACLRWSDGAAAHKQLQQLDAVWPAVRKDLVGPQWDSTWADWQNRLDQVREEIEEQQKSGKRR